MQSLTVLDQIAEKVKQSLERRKALCPEDQLAKLCEVARTPHPILPSFSGDRIQAIAEIKFSSPSEGAITVLKNPAEVARSYLQNGATVLSILTEEDYFHGSPGYLSQVRAAFPEAKLLMKDFIIDPYQIREGLILGADMILLIVSLLGEEKTREFQRFARSLGLTALVEVHDEQELEIASRAGASLIGINNRNLKTLSVDLETSFRLAKMTKPGAILISESGIRTSEEVRRLRHAGFSGILVGTSLMQKQDPGLALAGLLEANKR